MADNTVIQEPTIVGDVISTEDISGVKVPRSKVVLGDHGTDSGDVSVGNPMPVNVQNGVEVGLVEAANMESMGSSYAQRIKIVSGDEGTDNGDVNNANPLPVAPKIVTVDSSNFSQNSGSGEAILTYPASSGVAHVIGGIAWSYTGATSFVGNLTILDWNESATMFSIDITNPGPGFFPFDPPITTGLNNGFTIILNGTDQSSINGKITVLSHWTVNEL